MPVYRASEMTTFVGGSGESEFTTPCSVRLDAPEIVVSYREDDTHVVYRGYEARPGHFELIATAGTVGTATLHRVADDDDLLVGRWREDGQWGLWQIQLIDDE